MASHYLCVQVEGKGNGIKTVVVNMVDVAKALNRPPLCKAIIFVQTHKRVTNLYCKYSFIHVFECSKQYTLKNYTIILPSLTIFYVINIHCLMILSS